MRILGAFNVTERWGHKRYLLQICHSLENLARLIATDYLGYRLVNMSSAVRRLVNLSSFRTPAAARPASLVSRRSFSAGMKQPAVLSETDIEAALSGPASGWAYSHDSDRGVIKRTFTFPDFTTAWSFMSRVALHAEKRDHHPEWFNVYNRVEVVLSTHDAGNRVTNKDIELASIMNQCASPLLR